MKRRKLTREEYKHRLLVDMPYVVLHVLLRNKALGLYCNNILSTSADFYCVNCWIYSKDPLVWLDSAFWWEFSPEGMMFWSNIYDQVLIELINQ